MGWGIEGGVVWLIVAAVLVLLILVVGMRKEANGSTDLGDQDREVDP